MKYLIDECLSPSLVHIAKDEGFDSAHVNHRGLRGKPDHVIMKYILDGDWTFMTNNADDFRPPPGSPSERPCYVGVDVHAGLICLNIPVMPDKMPEGGGIPIQERYFKDALDGLTDILPDLTNKILEVDPVDPKHPDPMKGATSLKIYDFPENS